MNPTTDARRIAGRNMRFGWFALLLFATLGIALETMHGFKIGWYLDVGNEVRRLMWRLAHAHGGLLAIVNILFALVAGSQEDAAAERLQKGLPAADGRGGAPPPGVLSRGNLDSRRGPVHRRSSGTGRGALLPGRTRPHRLRPAPEQVTGPGLHSAPGYGLPAAVPAATVRQAARSVAP